MASSEDLVPRGLPQGSRQQVEAQMQAAGLPLGSSPGSAAPVAPAPGPALTAAPGAPPSGRDMLRGFDVFADRAPSPGLPPPQRDVVFARVRASQNPILQDIFNRVPGFKEG